MSGKEHWDSVYSTKSADRVSWFKPHLDLSMRLIRETGLPLNEPVIDVGGGASTLVDDLLAEGFSDVTVIDVSGAAIERTNERLGPLSQTVTWIVNDILCADLPHGTFGLWHDRAVFHFLTEPSKRRSYVAALTRATKFHAHVVMATFGPDGPERCSGLPVVRFSPQTLGAELGSSFELVSSVEEQHETPSGSQQQFIFCLFARRHHGRPT